jgi:SAM-dependent methyltransferase
MLTTVCRPFNVHMHRVLDPVLSLPPGSAVLDAGCGTGTVARWLAERGHRVLGIDLEPPEDATTGAAGPVPLPGGGTLWLRRGDILDLPREIPAGQTYDAVLLLGVLHYAGSAEGVRRTLRAIDEVAAPGAPLAVSWICDEIPLSYEEAYLPGRGLVVGALGNLGWTTAAMWDRDVTHAHGGSPEHDHRVVYGVWRRS